MIKKFFQHNKILLIFIIVFIYIFWVVAFVKLPKEAIPQVNLPFYVVAVQAPWNDAKTIYLQYVKKLERKIATVKHVSTYKGLSADDVWILTVEFERWTPFTDSYNDLKSAIDEASVDFSKDVKILIKRVDVVDMPVLVFSVVWDKDIKKLYDKIRFLKDDIEKIPWVNRVDVIWWYVPQIEVKFDYDKIKKLWLNYQNLIWILSLESVKFWWDLKILNKKLYSFVFSTYPTDLSGNLIEKIKFIKTQIENTSVINLSWKVLYVKDIAQVNINAPFFKKLSFVNGAPAIWFYVYKVPWTDMLVLIKKIKDYLNSLNPYFEKNWLKVVYIYSLKDDIKRVFNTFIENFRQTALIILIVLFIFLGFKYAFWVFLAFPLVYLLVFIYFWWKGFTFNSVVSFSLVLTLWIMVDNLIVIVDWIKEYFSKFKWNILDAIDYSIKTYWQAMLAGNLTTIVMFVPIWLALAGRVGEFIKYLPVAVNVTLIISILVAWLFLPVILLMIFKNKSDFDKRTNIDKPKSNNLSKVYYLLDSILEIVLKNPKKVIISFWLLFFVSLFLFVKFWSMDFLPATDKNNIYVNIEYQPDTTLEKNREYTAKIYNFVKKYFDDKRPGIVENIQVDVGNKTVFLPLQRFFYFNSFNPDISTINVKLIDYDIRSDEQNAVYIYQDLDNRLKKFVSSDRNLAKNIKDIYAFILKNSPSAWREVQFSLVVSGFVNSSDNIDNKLGILLKNYQMMKPELEKIPWTYGWTTSLEYSNGKVNIVYDIDKIVKYRLNVNEVNQFLFSILQNEKIYKWYWLPIWKYNDLYEDPIYIKSYLILTWHKWQNIKLPWTNIYLWQIIKSIKILPKIKFYSSEDSWIVLKVSAFKKPDVTLWSITKQIDKIIKNYPEVKLFYSADIKDMKSAMSQLKIAFAVWMFLMFLVLVWNFWNIRYSLVVYSILPLLLIWTFWFLLFFNLPFSFPAQLWVFGLIWVGVNNAILLVERYLQLKSKNRGLSKDEILMEVVNSRLRPVFLTTFTTVLGLITLAIKDELWGSLAMSFMGGLIFGTLITLFYIPAWLKVLKD